MNAPHSQASAVFGCTKDHGGPGIFSHMYDVKGREHWSSEQHEELRYQTTYHMHLASGGRLSYTPSIKLVTGRTVLLSSFSGVQCIAVKLKHGMAGIQTVAFWWSNVVD